MTNGIHVRIFGGLGNQLFIYACAKAISHKKNVPLILDNKSGFLKDKYKRSYKLDCFNITSKESSISAFFYLYITKKIPLLGKILSKGPIYLKEQDPRTFQPEILNNSISDFTYLDGYWQSFKYFENVEDIIRNDLKIKRNFSSNNLRAAENIRSKNSVAIHVRRTNYNPLLDISYYEKSIQKILEKVESPEFYIFSDDIDFCKTHFKIDSPIYFIDHNGDDEIADFWLMTQCKHFIIANSSYSWWAAWLGNYCDKIIIAPAAIHIGVINNFFPESWILI